MGGLTDSSGFLVALLTASVASLVAVVIARGTARSIALGIAVVVATLVGLGADDVLRDALVLALVVLMVAALVAQGFSLGARIAALAPGAALLATAAAPGTSGWARLVAFLTVLGAGPATAVLDRRLPELTFSLLAVSALGAYATVPDTEHARVLVGALLPVALVSLPWRRKPEASGPITGVALLVWVALVGGVGRPGAVVGAIGCLGVLALGPLARRSGPVRLVLVHVAVVLVASRVIGLRQSAWVAVSILAPVMVVAAIVLAAGERGRARDPS